MGDEVLELERPAEEQEMPKDEGLQDKFIGLKVSQALKDELQARAEREGKSVGEVIKSLLAAGGVGDESRVTAEAVGTSLRNIRDEWEELAEEAIRLREREERLEDLVRRNSGLLMEAPENLRLALKLTRDQIRVNQRKLEGVVPKEERKRKKSGFDLVP